ncbi:acyl-CoA dehydrogenase [Natrialba magadii ATCC 43099]|uniref:Acyl-CoA dehydrogenase n=1 Tax=Natrialba magadii (strain ATCC 43099 / DSM 3394 / CCM 3739 / CIP 104546 / IAM 13178 / JCM 8861 / NBRC 102185 / NCIMB 2190 / MS3) TaxID=547559 RepID=D3SW32_NATMM|nr:acyl-CoA dehydrogenase family protein [Natrialba magadii]ADD05693.1 acyl-CoA dehydrogenase [Natrialba magadii ATCC 43099]ELY29896.1 acyl-CoA dehydrogenase domain-containing protein [Natrialba magadii ATCC 43099]
MNFESTQERDLIRQTAADVAAEYGPEHWREKEEAGEFSEAFWDELAEAGFHGLLIPEEYEGAGMGMQEMGLAMETLCAEGCGMAGTWYLVLTAGMAAVGIREYGTESQKETYLPDIANGKRNFSIGITEPEAGTNTLNVATKAEKDGDEYVLNGQKAWITFSDRAENMIIVTRTTPREEVDRGTDGISLFIVDMDDSNIDVSPIDKHGINYSKSCEVFLENVRVPEENMLGDEGDGWWVLVDMLNPERIGFAAAGTGIGKLAANTAIEYANEREVFDAPIGSHQGVSFPIAKPYAKMETATLMREKAAWLYDQGEDCAYETNVAKATAVSAGIEAVKQSMQAFGGWGYATEYDVERWWREINLTRLAPVSQQMAYNHISQQLGFPKSY